MFWIENRPSEPVKAVAVSGGFAVLEQSARRASTVAPTIGWEEPLITTFPEMDAVPGGSCACGFGNLAGAFRPCENRASANTAVKVTALRNRFLITEMSKW